MSKKSEEDRAWMLEALDEEERVEHGLPEHEPKPDPPKPDFATLRGPGVPTREDHDDAS